MRIVPDSSLSWCLLGLCWTGAVGLQAGPTTAPPAQIGRPASGTWRFLLQDGSASLFVWTDTCNAYLLREGEAGLMIDLGDGSGLDHLREVGVRQVEWVLFTHHHREQCQGFAKLRGGTTRIAGPAAERALFEHPTDFRKMQVRLGDPFTIHGSSYVRPPIQPIPLDRAFQSGDILTWRGHDLQCLETPGNSPGSLSYLLDSGAGGLAFSGDLMLAGARLHTWFDTEWDYGFAAGLRAQQQSVARLLERQPAWLLPSHGPVLRRPETRLREFKDKLGRLEKLYVRGYGAEAASAAYQDKVSQPTVISNLWQVSPHLFKFKRPNFWPNFGLILADSGHALVVDCGLLDESFLDAALAGLTRSFGLKAIDAVIITHMHGDHFLEAPHLRETWGAPVWGLDRMAAACEHPEQFDYAAPVQAYGKKGLTGLRFDRLFKPGESFVWEGERLTVDWMPGQTEFALCLHGRIDGRKVAFTGDNLFGDPDDPTQTGHEAMVAHNSAILEEGYILAGEYLKRLRPDLLVGGHSFVMDHPGQLIERYRRWAYAMREAFRSVAGPEDYRYWFDPFWVRAEPYRVTLRPGETRQISLHLRNFNRARQRHRIEIHTPAGLRAEPAVLEGRLAGASRAALPFRLSALPGTAAAVHIVAFDVTLDGRRYGERFDLITEVKDTD